MTDNFYRSIAEYYDRIFPLHEDALCHLAGLAQAVSPDRSARVLDLGCATGAMASALAEEGHRVTGIDLDPAMIDLAQSRVDAVIGESRSDEGFHSGGRCEFSVLDMTASSSRFGESSFDMAYCMGNTLVHLTKEDLLSDFFAQMAAIIKPDGVFSLQIINYDRILDNRINGLPTIEGDGVIFEREYKTRGDGLLDFSTAMTDTSTGLRIENSIPLLPLRARDLEALLAEAGFKVWRFSGNFKGAPFNPQSYALVADAVTRG